MPYCKISDRAQMSKTIIAVRHFGLGGRESLETAVTDLCILYIFTHTYTHIHIHTYTYILYIHTNIHTYVFTLNTKHSIY